MIENRLSHNDYWNKIKLHYALLEGCNIIELDVICLKDKLYLSHSWRPFPWLTYGDPEDYFKQAAYYHKKNIYLYIEVKTSNEKAIRLLLNMIDKYDGEINIFIKGIDRWFSRKRKYIAHEVYKQNRNVKLFEVFEEQNEIEPEDLYRDSWYKLWNRW